MSHLVMVIVTVVVGIIMTQTFSNSIPAAKTLIISGPTLSLLYAVSIQGFLSMWHECSWTHLIVHILAYTLWLAVALIIALSTQFTRLATDSQATLLWTFAGIFLILSTRTLTLLRTTHVLGPNPIKDSNRNSLLGKVVLITGANTGIGKETARILVTHFGATVIMACRSDTRAQEAKRDIVSSCTTTQMQQEVRNRLHVLVMDVSSLDSVRCAVDILQNSLLLSVHKIQASSTDYNAIQHPCIDILINNAGVMMGTYQTSVDGFELTMASNHIGHFLLTELLVPFLRQSTDPRIIQLTSSTYALASNGIDLEDFFCDKGKRKYSLFGQYAQSKLANILMSLHFHQIEAHEHNPIAIFNVHPGLVRTDVVRNMPWYLKYPNIIFGFILALLQKNPEAGAYTSVFCASSPTVKDKSGCYFVNSKVVITNASARDFSAAKKLWEASKIWVKHTRYT